MPTKQQRRSYAHETELAKIGIRHHWLAARRAWGSNGESLGWPKEVDVAWTGHLLFRDVTIQSKVRLSYPNWLVDGCKASDAANQHFHVYGKSYVLMPLDRLVQWATEGDVIRARETPDFAIRSHPKWFTGEYLGSLSACDALVFREMKAGHTLGNYAIIEEHTFYDSKRSKHPASSTFCPHCGEPLD